MKTHFALLLPLLPSITQGRYVNLRGAILQDEPKSTSRDLTGGVVLVPCLSYSDAISSFAPLVPVATNCTSNMNCTNPGEKCLIQSNPYAFLCGTPIVNVTMPLCDEPSTPPPTTTPPPPPPTTPPPDDRDDTCDLSYDEAFVRYWNYVGPAVGRGIFCGINNPCPAGLACLLAANFANITCGIPNGQAFVLCDVVP